MKVESRKEQGARVGHLMQHCAEKMTLTSTCDDFVELINQNEKLGAKIAVKVMGCSIETCDTDMLMESYHRFFDDTVIVGAGAVHICAVDAAAEVQEDWLISLPLN